MGNNETKKEKEKIYKFYGKEYVLRPEINKSGCQGCAFYNRIDCHSTGKTEICTKEHKVFMRHLKVDE